MGLAELQTALARLYVDEEFRRQLGDGTNAEMLADLTSAEREQLLSLAESDSRLSQFAESLIAKRRGEVAKLLPATACLLGDEFRTVFRKYAGEVPLRGLHKHLSDAVAFAQRVGNHPSLKERPWAQEVARFEADRMVATHDQPLVKIHFYRYPVHRLIFQVTETDQKVDPPPTKQKTWLIWYTPPRRSTRCGIFSF